ncbi:hypothetical protein [Methylobacterium variabile]|jgi:hypothetical protein|nr:hypothetical protein [Methylobacterium variabile]
MKIEEVNAKLEAQVKIQTWLIGAIGLMIAFIGILNIYLSLNGH